MKVYDLNCNNETFYTELDESKAIHEEVHGFKVLAFQKENEDDFLYCFDGGGLVISQNSKEFDTFKQMYNRDFFTKKIKPLFDMFKERVEKGDYQTTYIVHMDEFIEICK